MKYEKGFDTLRAFAVFFVIISHWGTFFTPGSKADVAIKTVMPSGQFGVTLFFVLSGFLITSILLTERYKYQETGTGRTTIIKSFFIRRCLRIFPIYYLCLTVLALAGNTYLRGRMGYYFLYLGNIPPYIDNHVNPLIHTWSLAVEEQFYLLWPWVILFVRERWLKYVFALAIAVGIISKYIVLFVLHHDFAMLVINCFDAFGIGGLYAYVSVNRQNEKVFERGYGHLLAVMLFVMWMITPYRGLPLAQLYSRTLECVVSGGLIIFVLNNPYSWVRKYLLENKVLNYLGKISYGLYLYHFVIGSYCDELWVKMITKAPSALLIHLIHHLHVYMWFFRWVVLLILCMVSYHFIEVPLLRLKKKFPYSLG